MNYSDSTVQSGQTYYYVTTAVSSTGTESAYSNQVTAVVPFPWSGSFALVWLNKFSIRGTPLRAVPALLIYAERLPRFEPSFTSATRLCVSCFRLFVRSFFCDAGVGGFVRPWLLRFLSFARILFSSAISNFVESFMAFPQRKWQSETPPRGYRGYREVTQQTFPNCLAQRTIHSHAFNGLKVEYWMLNEECTRANQSILGYGIHQWIVPWHFKVWIVLSPTPSS
jgi:hypothetical protein